MYMTAIEARKALRELGDNPSVTDLYNLVRNTSAKPENSNSNQISFPYINSNNNEKSWQMAGDIAKNNSNFVRIDDTPLGKLLFDTTFQRKLRLAIGNNIDSSLPKNQRISLIDKNYNKIFNNTDIKGERLSINPDKPSMWDLASKRFVEESNGNFRIVMGTDGFDSNTADPKKLADFKNSIFHQTELPALLN